jgi:hypothetical protein
VLRFSAPEFRSLINALEGGLPGLDGLSHTDGSEILSAPRVTTLLGRQAHVAVQENQMIAGRNQALGPSLDVMPTLSADGGAVDIDIKAEYTVAVKGR